MGRHHRHRSIVAAVAAAIVVVGCSGGETTAPPVAGTAPPETTTTIATVATLPPLTEDAALLDQLGNPELLTPGCDALDQRACLLPFPSDTFTVDDPSTDTGKRISLSQMPANAQGATIDPAEWNRNDGFSPNTPIMTFVAGLDPVASRLPSWTDPAASLADDSPVVLVDLATARRIPLWAELDAKATDDADRLLIIHPAVPLDEGHQYVVALRRLSVAGGATAEPSPVFRALRDRIAGPEWLEARRPEMENNFAVARLRRTAPGRPVPRLELHRVEHEEHRRADPRHP